MKIHKMCRAATSSLRDLGNASHGRQCLNGISKDKFVFVRCGRELPMQNWTGNTAAQWLLLDSLLLPASFLPLFLLLFSFTAPSSISLSLFSLPPSTPLLPKKCPEVVLWARSCLCPGEPFLDHSEKVLLHSKCSLSCVTFQLRVVLDAHCAGLWLLDT